MATDINVQRQHDWSALDAMTEEEKHAAALSDPDAQACWQDYKNRKKGKA